MITSNPSASHRMGCSPDANEACTDDGQCGHSRLGFVLGSGGESCEHPADNLRDGLVEETEGAFGGNGRRGRGEGGIVVHLGGV